MLLQILLTNKHYVTLRFPNSRITDWNIVPSVLRSIANELNKIYKSWYRWLGKSISLKKKIKYVIKYLLSAFNISCPIKACSTLTRLTQKSTVTAYKIIVNHTANLPNVILYVWYFLPQRKEKFNVEHFFHD